jgi:hypothetical protein
MDKTKAPREDRITSDFRIFLKTYKGMTLGPFLSLLKKVQHGEMNTIKTRAKNAIGVLPLWKQLELLGPYMALKGAYVLITL